MKALLHAILALAAPAALAWPACDQADITPPVAIVREAPAYPPAVREIGIEGSVEVALTVLRDGQVGWVRVLRADPPGYFEQAALAGVRAWSFQPARRDGQPVECRLLTRVRFTLADTVDASAPAASNSERPDPIYPASLLVERIEGYAEVKFDVLPDGSVANAKLTMVMPRGEFEAAVLAAIRGWHFSPEPGDPRPMTRRFEFRLPDSTLDELPTTAFASAPFPVEACKRRVRGSVGLEVETDATGAIQDARILASEPKGLFDHTALAIARASRLTPAYRDGRPIAATALLTLVFDPDKASCPGSLNQDPQRPQARPPATVSRHDETTACPARRPVGRPVRVHWPAGNMGASPPAGGSLVARELLMKRISIAAMAAMASLGAAADEGMWTFDNPPHAAIESKFGVTLDDAWLDRVRGATVRLETGCTGSFISAEGLILTNHHCAEDCVAQNSTAERDLVASGFLVTDRKQELRCQEDAVSVLVGTEEVTAKVTLATAGLGADAVVAARRKVLTELEQACEENSAKSKGGPLKCERVTLYQGGQYWIYKYKRYEDVRLVFVPDRDIAAFGGDPDNFQFPRWCLDMSILRAYEDGKPAQTPNRLRFDWDGADPGDPVFVSGHPGNTDRLLTVAQLETQRTTFMPFWLMRFSELRGRMLQYAKTGPEALRTSEAYLNQVENSIKVRRKQFDALLDPALLEAAGRNEQALHDAVAASPELTSSADAWQDIEAAQRVWRDMLVPYTFIEGGAAFNSTLYGYARDLVRAAAERSKANESRLAEYTEARLPALLQNLQAAAPIYPDFEVVRLSFALERMREWLGPDDPLVRKVFGNDSPDALANRLVRQSALADPAARVALYDGGLAALDASQDPMIRLAAIVDPTARALRERYEEQVEGPVQRGQEAIAKARFAVYGTSIYPDATFTLRLSYGAMMGWKEKGEDVRPWTELSRAFERATGQAPFKIPDRWLAAKDRLDMTTPANFTTNNDIVGGNSGSPMLSAAGDIVGLAFDGNIHSISGSYWFDERLNRSIGVHPAYIRTALERVYEAKVLLGEIDAGR